MSKIVVLASFYPKNEKNNEVKETILAKGMPRMKAPMVGYR